MVELAIIPMGLGIYFETYMHTGRQECMYIRIGRRVRHNKKVVKQLPVDTR